jgi:hypothetical protein
MATEPDHPRTVQSESGRVFLIQPLFFQNGCFFIISEGQNRRIGSISISISSSNKVNTAKVIPSKFDSVFINTITEKVSAMINGICLASLYSKSQLSLDDMKAIMGEVMDIVRDRGDSGAKRGNESNSQEK